MDIYETGIYYFYLEDRMLLYIDGSLVSYESDAEMNAGVQERVKEAVEDGTLESMKADGKVPLFFTSHIYKAENSNIFDIKCHISEDYGPEVIEILKDYDSYHRIQLRVLPSLA